jgi:hypothetical protein
MECMLLSVREGFLRKCFSRTTALKWQNVCERDTCIHVTGLPELEGLNDRAEESEQISLMPLMASLQVHQNGVSLSLPKHMPQIPWRAIRAVTVIILPWHGTWNAQNDSVNIIINCMNMATICEIICAISISVAVTPAEKSCEMISLQLWITLFTFHKICLNGKPHVTTAHIKMCLYHWCSCFVLILKHGRDWEAV